MTLIHQLQTPTTSSDRQGKRPKCTPINDSFFTSPNSLSLSKIETNEKEIIPNTTQLSPIAQIEIDHITDSTLKIPPLFIINVPQLSQLRIEISEMIKNDFTATGKYEKI